MPMLHACIISGKQHIGIRSNSLDIIILWAATPILNGVCKQQRNYIHSDVTHTCRVESYWKSSCSITSSLGWGTAPWDTPLKLIFHFLQTMPLSVMTIWVKSFEGDGTWAVASNSFFAPRISFFKVTLFNTSSLAWLSRTLWRLLALSAIGEQSKLRKRDDD